MINVTLGEVKTQEEKPFPKLMQSDSGRIVYMIKKGQGYYIGGAGGYEFLDFSKEWAMCGFTDYNEPIILQNA